MKKDIRYALKDEKGAVPMYQGIKADCPSQSCKNQIDKIIKDEKKHKKILENIIRSN
jgi:rubrerythrin